MEYRAGGIDTLVRVVDANGGYTVIPELHVCLLSEAQRKNLRPIVCGGRDGREGGCPVREISLMIREDFVRDRLLNIIRDCIRSIIPEKMLDSGHFS